MYKTQHNISKALTIKEKTENIIMKILVTLYNKVSHCKKNIFKICNHKIVLCQINLNNLFSSDNLLF